MNTSRASAITVVGRDRPGIIAEVTAQVADLGLNLEDSSMTLLRGHFAMTLVCRGDRSAAEVAAALSAGADLAVTVRELPVDESPGAPGSPWVLTVYGGDRPGIVSAVLGEVARVGGNVTDLSTRLAGELYVLVAELELPAGVEETELAVAIDGVAGGLGVSATLRPADADEL